LIKAAVFGGFYFLAATGGRFARGTFSAPETAGCEAPLQGHRFFIRGGIQLLFTQSSEFCSKIDFMENTGGFFGKKPRIFHYFSWNSGCKNVSFFVE